MGTSTSSKGPGNKSPLVPAWADKDNQGPGDNDLDQRFRSFRTILGQAASSGGVNKDELKKALGHYASNATGGATTGVRRFSPMITAGGSFFEALKAFQSNTNTAFLNISTLQGQPTDIVIDHIINSITQSDGDSERIRAALNQALAESLDGLDTFDFSIITDDIIIEMMLNYTSQCIFEQIILDSRTAFDKADTPEKIENLETNLMALIKISVDLQMKSHLELNLNSNNQLDIIQIQTNALESIWTEWEEFLND